MSVVNISSSWSSPEANPEQLAQLAVTISRGLTRVLMDDIAPAIGDALAQIALAAHADRCQLLEFAASGVVARVHVPTRPAKVAAPEHQALAPRGVARRASQTRRPREHFTARRASAKGNRQPGPGSPYRSVLHPGDTGVARRRGGMRPGHRQQPVAAMVAAARRAAAAPVRDPGGGDAAGSARERAAGQRHGHRTAQCAARSRQRVFEGRDQDLPRLRRHRRRQRGAAARARGVAQVAPTNSTVLLLGPTGTGKELFARALHERSRRHARPLVRVNCAALAADAGRERAVRARKRRIHRRRRAASGTVRARRSAARSSSTRSATCRSSCRSKLLRVLQEGEFERVGIVADEEGRRARDCGHPSGSRGGRRRGRVPRGPVLPPERLSDPPAAAARTRRRHSAPGVVRHSPAPACMLDDQHRRCRARSMDALQRRPGPATSESSRTSSNAR